ncbi:TNFAIP3-interacting protein 2-like [Haliotis rufescens]|uniref:TNFAIP3-interacting protein 2-like n=1 Tax=Haliotis rufescens TaxID=6454 RepID=UPI001EB0090D|nr:TNFAIP3-interacting protein 2-like [Haliotis rufescens]
MGVGQKMTDHGMMSGKGEPEYPTMQCGSRLTVEQERDWYKEKLLHMKVVFREMQHSLQSQKIRKEGVETVSVLLKESRQQITTLENQKRALETAVRNLQNRLANHGLSNSVTFEENELFIPGTSKQILDNLAKENARLRNLLGMSGGFEDVSKLHETIERVQGVSSNLQVENDNLLQKVTDLENMLKSSDSDKDKMICQLREHIDKLQSNSRTQDVLCQSMSGEVSGLRYKLKDFVLQCQQLEMKLEDAEQNKVTFTQQEVPVTEVKYNQKSEDTPDGNIILEETTRLKEELKTLKEMNRRWQDYNSDRERYTQELHSNYRELQQRYKTSQESRITEERERQLNNLLVTAKEKLEKMEVDKKQLAEKLEASEATVGSQMIEMQQLRLMSGGGDLETIAALKAQIQVCTEDFETERQDRAKAQARAHLLQEEVNNLRVENNQLRCSGNQNLLSRQSQVYSRHQSIALEPPQLQARGWPQRRGLIVTDGNMTETDGNLPGTKSPGTSPRLITSRSPTNPSVPRHSPSFLTSGPVSLPVMRSDPSLFKPALRKKEEETLCCPKCGQGFSEEEQDKLLEHMEVCCE